MLFLQFPELMLHSCIPVKPSGIYQVFDRSAVSGKAGGFYRKAVLVQFFGKGLQFERASCQPVNQKDCMVTSLQIDPVVVHASFTISTALVPPKANELVMAVRTFSPGLPVLGT